LLASSPLSAPCFRAGPVSSQRLCTRHV
jgi:hypothetical protein